MKQREHYRYHNAWSKYYYGSNSEQEQYRAYTRSVLKQQMDDKQSMRKTALRDKVRESEMAIQQDTNIRQHDAKEWNRKFEHLKTFRDENKRLMENRWDNSFRSKLAMDKYDREQLKYNPINWSGSLK